MSKRDAGKRLPESTPSAECPKLPTGHIPDPTAPEWCVACDLQIADGTEVDLCPVCFEPHDEHEVCEDYVCDVCSMDGPMDGDRFDYSELDPGIRNSVKFLRDHGFWTTDSGDGKTKIGTGQYDESEVLNIPHIFIITEPRNLIEESRRVTAVLRGHGIFVQPQGFHGADASSFEYDELPLWDTHRAVEVEASYDPVTDTAVVILTYIDDTLLASTSVSRPEVSANDRN